MVKCLVQVDLYKFLDCVSPPLAFSEQGRQTVHSPCRACSLERPASSTTKPSALSQTPVYTARPQIQGSALRCVPVYVPAFAGTHCAYPQRDGQAELTWVAGYIPRWFTCRQTVTHRSTNQARRWLTMLMRPTTLPTKPKRHNFIDQQNQPAFAWQTTDFCWPILLADTIDQLYRSSDIALTQANKTVVTFVVRLREVNKPRSTSSPSLTTITITTQDHRTLLKAKYCPRVAVASCTQNTKKHVTLTFDWWPWNSMEF